jgi:thiol-disulfide isomerase/thioredoxin
MPIRATTLLTAALLLLAATVVAEPAPPIEAPAIQPSADELYSTIQRATTREDAIAAVKDYVEAYPKDGRSPELMYVITTAAESDEEKLRYGKMLLELHPDSKFAQDVRPIVRQIEGIGQPFELTFKTARSGEVVSVQDDLKGKVVVLDFWATWCGPCIGAMPKKLALYAKYRDRGVEFIGINLDTSEAEGGKTAMLEFLNGTPLPWPQYYQGNGWRSEFSGSWGVNDQIPRLFVIDADGKLATTNAGSDLEATIQRLLDERDAAS